MEKAQSNSSKSGFAISFALLVVLVVAASWLRVTFVPDCMLSFSKNIMIGGIVATIFYFIGRFFNPFAGIGFVIFGAIASNFTNSGNTSWTIDTYLFMGVLASVPPFLGLLGRGTGTNTSSTKTFSGPPCPECGERLTTDKAKQCRHCGADWQ